MSKRKTYNVAVVGATGAVGLEMVRMLEERKFPIQSLRLLASKRSAGKSFKFNGKGISIKVLDNEQLSGIDVALFSAGASISKEYAPKFADKGAFVIDNSTAWRMDPKVPLVVPEINSHALSKDKKIIANPNCSTIQMVLALKPIHDKSPIQQVRVSTYQSVSGAGGSAIRELEEQAKAWAKGSSLPPPSKTKHQIAFNVIPQIDVFQDNGYTKEEMKMVNETRKILEDPSIKVSATCVRVPVFRSHAESVWVQTRDPLSPDEVKDLLSRAPGIEVVDDPENACYPMPISAEGKSSVFVGRVRKDLVSDRGIVFWVVSDNLLKGAALNAVQIAESLSKKGVI